MKALLCIISFFLILNVQGQQSDFSEIDFSKADGIAQDHKGEELLNLPLLVHNLTSQLTTDAERFRAIYYWVCHNIEGNQFLIFKNNHKRKKLRNDSLALYNWNRAFKKEIFERLVKDKETLCTGYAYLIKEMANRAGIACEIVHGLGTIKKTPSGYPKGANHSWNAVKLDGKWYVCDPTWSAGYTNMPTMEFVFDYDDSYFLMEPKLFLKNHTPQDEQWSLLGKYN